jgi:large subunit ribosomal protein L28
MAKCFVCHKGTLKGFQVSHSSVKTRRFFKPNLHTLSVKFTTGPIKKIKICSKCYKKIGNQFWAGKTLPFVPLSLINQKKAKAHLTVKEKDNGQEKGTEK